MFDPYTEFMRQFPLFVLIATMLLVAFLRTRRTVFLPFIGALVVIALPSGIQFFALVRTQQLFSGYPLATLALCSALAAYAWVVVLGVTMWVVLRKRP